jgi:hypothetical protein
MPWIGANRPHFGEPPQCDGTGVAVYRGDGVSLRIGHGLEQEVATHLQMIANGFPVAAIIKQGVYDAQPCLIDESLGSSTLGEQFDAELEAAEGISAGSFSTFMDVVGRYARAQAAMLAPPGAARDFEQLVGVDRTAAHLPDVGKGGSRRVRHRRAGARWLARNTHPPGSSRVQHVCRRCDRLGGDRLGRRRVRRGHRLLRPEPVQRRHRRDPRAGLVLRV